MRLLGRYVFREVLGSAVLGTLLASFVLFLQKADVLFEAVVNSNGGASPRTVLTLFMWAMPPVLPLTIPFGVLVGILIGLGRLASDGEITAMRAAGVSSRKVVLPVLLFASLGMGLAGLASLRLTPLAIRESTRIVTALEATAISAQIEPRVFVENFPDRILYVNDVGLPPVVRWKPVFIADVTAPEKRSSGMREKADGPLITVAREAIAVSDPKNNRIELTLHDVYTHEMGKDRVANDTVAPVSTQVLEASPPDQKALSSRAMNTRQLFNYPKNGPDYTETQIELQRRFALPVACLALALVGIPLGVATRKGGKSAGYVIALFLGFFCYNLSSLALEGIAKQKTIPVPLAVWLPNIVFLSAGVWFLTRMERPGEHDLVGVISGFFGRIAALVSPGAEPAAGGAAKQRDSARWRLPLLPQIVDTYILGNFLFYLVMVLASLVSMILVYNFFELMGDMIRNKIPLMEMFTYLFFLTPELVYQTLPYGVLVAALIQLGVLSKQNEITAFRACGVSLYRLAAPILLGCTLFSAALFAFDYDIVPKANRRQDALRDEIKGRPKQTYYRLDRKWIMGRDSKRVYYYLYYDASANVMANVNVFDLDPDTFRLKREIVAERAQWSPTLKAWVFENGWSCEFQAQACSSYKTIQATTFPDLTEAPDYFLTEAVQEKQMNFLVLDGYIRGLREKGFPTGKLQVQFYLKFALPLFALIMAMIAVPFGFLVGSRGALTGIGVSLGIGIGYKFLAILFEKIGNVNLLPPTMAAWSPDVVFGLAGMYLLLRMRS